MSDFNRNTLMIFTTVSAIWAMVLGLIGPFYVLHIDKLSGGMEKLGVAFSIMIIFQAAATYIAGRYSDRIGRKPFIIMVGIADSIILFLYTVIQGAYQLFLLQALVGATTGIASTISSTFLGDLTVKEHRGTAIGKFNAFLGLASALGVTFSGFLVKYYSVTILFYIASIVVGVSTLPLFFIQESHIDSLPRE